MPARLASVGCLNRFRLSVFHDLLPAPESIVPGFAFGAGSFWLFHFWPSLVKEGILRAEPRAERGSEKPLDDAHCSRYRRFMADGKGCTCMAYGPHECACDADWTPQEIYDLRAVVVASVEAISKAMPYVTSLAAKNSAKGDEAMSVMSHMMRALDMAARLNGSPKQ
jgi:hypothetical protein